MRRTVFALLLLSGPVFAQTHTVKLGKHNFTLPKGFTIELVAESPQVDRPVTAAFDDKGRLYVADSSGDNSKPAEQLKKPTHRVVMLESTKKDGKFDKSTVFADKLSFLQGTMWHAGSLYVATPQTIQKLTDTDNDGVADKREVWFDGGVLTGCANDVHGPYPGPGGRIYWTKGAFAKQELTLGNGKKFTTRAAHIYSAKADGSDIRVEMTGGMDNPVDVAFNGEGELFFTSTFVIHPENGFRDGIIHNTYGAVYGKDHDVLNGHPRADPELGRVMTHLGPAAPAGLHRYNSNHFGKDYDQNLFCAQFNMAKVSRHVLKEKGSTYTTVDSDFVTSDNRDLHPTDVIEDADGSLLIVDTGGWYKLCCPSSVMEKKDVLGAIYRVRKTDGEKHVAKPHFPERGDEPPTLLQKTAFTAVHGNKNFVPTVLDFLANEKTDTVLDTALTRALIDIGEAKATRVGLRSKSPRVVRGALVALEQMPDGKLTPEDVLPFLESTDADLRNSAWWVVGRHPFWGHKLVSPFCVLLGQEADMTSTEFETAARRMAPFLLDTDVREFVAVGPPSPLKLRAVAVARWPELPADYAQMLANGLGDRNAEWVRPALAALRAVKPNALPETVSKALGTLADDAKRPTDVRLTAAAMLPQAPTDVYFNLALKSVGKDQPAAVRSAAWDVLAKNTTTAKQSLAVVESIPSASPLDFDKLLTVFAKSTDEAVGLALVKSLSEPKVRAAIRAEQVKPILDKYPKTVQTEAEKLYKLLASDRAEMTTKLETFLKDTLPGDVRKGQAVFNSAKAACTACHKIAYVGGVIGPDLTKIGGIRSEKDLLEAIVFPSASFVRSYEPVKVEMKDGRSFTGILKADTGAEVVLTVSATEEVRIARKDIDEMKPGTVSVMPAGLDQQLTKQELADLVAFLKSLK